MLVPRAEEDVVGPGDDGGSHPGLDEDPPTHQAGGQAEVEVFGW